MTEHPFNSDAFLAEPLTVRVASDGPTERPMWYQWEEGRFWLMTGPWSKLFSRVHRDPRIAMVIDVCELDGGESARWASAARSRCFHSISRAAAGC